MSSRQPTIPRKRKPEDYYGGSGQHYADRSSTRGTNRARYEQLRNHGNGPHRGERPWNRNQGYFNRPDRHSSSHSARSNNAAQHAMEGTRLEYQRENRAYIPPHNNRPHHYQQQQGTNNSNDHSSQSTKHEEKQNLSNQNIAQRTESPGNAAAVSGCKEETANANSTSSIKTDVSNGGDSALSVRDMSLEQFKLLSKEKQQRAREEFQGMNDEEKLQVEWLQPLHFDLRSVPRRFPPPCGDTVWQQRKERAVNDTLKAVKSRFERAASTAPQAYSDYDDDSSIDDGWQVAKPKSTVDGFNQETFEAYVKALPHCVYMTLGFDIQNGSNDEWCYCPCSDKKMGYNWRCLFGLPGAATCSVRKSQYKPGPLMAHFESITLRDVDVQCFFHELAHCYTKNLYRDYNKETLGHRALYKLNDKNHNDAVNAETRRHQRMVDELRSEVEKLRDEKFELEIANSEMEKNREELEAKIKKMLQIETDDKATKQVLQTVSISRVADHCKRYWDNVRFLGGCREENDVDEHKKQPPIRIFVPQSKDMEKVTNKTQEVFDKWYNHESGGKKKGTLLFYPLGKNNFAEAIRHLTHWNVQYGVVVQSGYKKEDKAVDEGGPSRKFLNDLWKYMNSLKVVIGKDDDEEDILVELFTMSPSGFCVPIEDDALKAKIRIAIKKKASPLQHPVKKESNGNKRKKGGSRKEIKVEPGTDADSQNAGEMKLENLLDKISCYYRAIGRAMIHCIATAEFKSEKHAADNDSCRGSSTILGHALPMFYRNLLFRGYEPSDVDYPISDLVKHVSELTCGNHKNGEELLEYLKQALLVDDIDDDVGGIKEDEKGIAPKGEKILRQYASENWVEGRGIALKALKEGLTLNGVVELYPLFGCMELDTMNKLIFSKLVTSAEDVIRVLSVGPVGDDVTGEEVKDFFQVQNKLFSKILPSWLREKENTEYIPKFLEFCTGQSFLGDHGYHEHFKILIEFSEKIENSLPKAHTCVNTVVIPIKAYGGSYDLFKEKMELAIDGTGGGFSMQ